MVDLQRVRLHSAVSDLSTMRVSSLCFLLSAFIASVFGQKKFNTDVDKFSIALKVSSCAGAGFDAKTDAPKNEAFVKLMFLRTDEVRELLPDDLQSNDEYYKQYAVYNYVMSYTGEIDVPVGELKDGATIHISAEFPTYLGCRSRRETEKSVCDKITHVLVHMSGMDCMQWDTLTVLTPFNKKFVFNWMMGEGRRDSCEYEFCDSSICGDYFKDKKPHRSQLTIFKRDDEMGLTKVREQYLLPPQTAHEALEHVLEGRTPTLHSVLDLHDRVFDIRTKKSCIYKNPNQELHKT